MQFTIACAYIVAVRRNGEYIDTHLRVRSVSELNSVVRLIRSGAYGLLRRSAFRATIFHSRDGLKSSAYPLFTKGGDDAWVLNPQLVSDLLFYRKKLHTNDVSHQS